MNGKIKVWATKEEEEVRKSSQQRKTAESGGKEGKDVKRRGEGVFQNGYGKERGSGGNGGFKRRGGKK